MRCSAINPMEQLPMSLLSFDKFVKDDGRLVPDWHQDVEKPLTCSMRPHFVERWQAVEEFRERERTISCDISSASVSPERRISKDTQLEGFTGFPSLNTLEPILVIFCHARTLPAG